MADFAGFEVDKNVLDSIVGGVVVKGRQFFEEVARIQVFLDENNDAALTSLGYGPVGIAQLRDGIGALSTLGRIAHNQQSGPQDDYFFHARKLSRLR